ncbi:MAG TPA: glutamate synthase [Planctomycetota bacterium]|jgi:glutamate synthase domain-containing protein 1/glutamate synthase domain-containing protein 3
MKHKADLFLAGRKALPCSYGSGVYKEAEEGGCGVTGFACTEPVRGRHIYEPSVQMHNRGNGKGGGIAAVGMVPEQLGVSREVLDTHYLIQIALLHPGCHNEVEQRFILPNFNIAHSERVARIDDYRDIPGLDVQPPDVHRYFVRVKPEVLRTFTETNNLGALPARDVEDEFVYRNTYKLNDAFYASLGDKQAFVLSHGRNLVIFKLVGYAEKITQYYQLDDFKAHIWIAHQRYPTKGRVWHPGGAHPFIGLNEALVHNGDFANYVSVAEYLQQRNIKQQFLTDTEVSVQLFDLWDRLYGYPLEYIIEGLAPTTELDFDRLPPEKQKIYRQIQATCIHGSPDGPWFFIIARSQPDKQRFQLLGITDTAMLRPQVFALSEGEVQVGLICSEKQAIDATLRSIARDDPRVCPVADRYWNARGGSSNDGGSFIFTIDQKNGKKVLNCTDKFGRPVVIEGGKVRCDLPSDCSAGVSPVTGSSGQDARTTAGTEAGATVRELLQQGDANALFQLGVKSIPTWSAAEVRAFCKAVTDAVDNGPQKATAIEALSLLRDRHYDCGDKRRCSVLQLLDETLKAVFASTPRFGEPGEGRYRRVDWSTRERLAAPQRGEEVLVVDTDHFEPEGDNCDAYLLASAHELGWKRYIVYNYNGQRFTGCGFGAMTDDVRIDIYGSSGDYIASGMDGMTIVIHGNAQDQLGQVMKRGKFVVHGDVGQTFMYGAKGGHVYILGNGAGRPLINAVGRPRVVINGTCLDYLAESFMAGDPTGGGGFVILNGMRFDDKGGLVPLDNPYPGGNLFSLASGGAIYIRDPEHKVIERQLNGGEFTPLSDKDWRVIRPMLEENERLFGVRLEELLTVNGKVREPADVYRRISAVKLKVLAAASKDKGHAAHGPEVKKGHSEAAAAEPAVVASKVAVEVEVESAK